MRILVAGATGLLGTEIVRRLRAQGHEVSALARTTSDPARVAFLRELGARVVQGDLRDLASLRAAVAGMDGVVSTATVIRSSLPDDSFLATDRDGNLALVDVAREARVSRFVFVSFTTRLNGDDDLSRAKRAVEAKLRTSGVPYTILKPCAFMEAWLGPAAGFDAAKGTAVLLGDQDAPLSYVSQDDVAEFVARTIADPRAKDREIEIGGPRPLSAAEAVTVFESVTGRRFQTQRMPIAALEGQLASAPNPHARVFASLMLAIARGSVVPEAAASAEEFGVRLRPIEEWARLATKGA